MKKALPVLAALCVMLILAACCAPHTKADASGEGLKLKDPLEGIWKPADDPQASFSYRFPQFEADTEYASKINEHYLELSKKAQEYSIDFEIIPVGNRYLSVILHCAADHGQGGNESISSDVFALDGIYAGEKLALSQMLGLEQKKGSGKLSEHVWNLVWQIVERDSHNAEGDYLDQIEFQDVISAFDPEMDFYLDSDENIVFFIQPGMIAGEIAGVLTYPFSAGELLSSLKE